MIIPTIQRISPKLARCRKCIRRASCNRYRFTLFIQLEKLRIRPGICTVKSNVNRNVSYNQNTLLIRILLKTEPLRCKKILLEFIEQNLFLKLFAVFLHGFLITIPDVFIPA